MFDCFKKKTRVSIRNSYELLKSKNSYELWTGLLVENTLYKYKKKKKNTAKTEL